MTDKISNALSVFPDVLKYPLAKACRYFSDIYEIRLIADISVYLVCSAGIRFVGIYGETSAVPTENQLRPTRELMEEITDRAIGFSGFSHEKELRTGFISYGEACRMGICTSGDSEFLGRGDIYSLCIRIPLSTEAEYPDCIDSVLSQINSGILVCGPPSCGKTTLLRYIARRLSDGVTGRYRKVLVIDERRELSDGYYLGMCTDVIRGKKKDLSLLHALRLMSPEFVVCDEIGAEEETQALLQGLNSGICFIASMHADSISALMRRSQFRILFRENVFGRIIFLSGEVPGKIDNIYDGSDVCFEAFGTHGALSVL